MPPTTRALDDLLTFDDHGAVLTIPEGPNGEAGALVRYAHPGTAKDAGWRAWVKKDAAARVEAHGR
jgi:hypothetical protein